MPRYPLDPSAAPLPSSPSPASPASPPPQSEPALSREQTAAAVPTRQVEDRERSRSPPPASASHREDLAHAGARFTAQPGTPLGGERAPPFPFPLDQRHNSTNSLVSANLYVEFRTGETQNESLKETRFSISEAVAEFESSENLFALRKIPVDAEIDVNSLPEKATRLFAGPSGSRENEWANMASQVKESGGPAVRIHRGARAKDIRTKFAHRLIPSRWLDTWKDMGDDYVTPLTPQVVTEADVPENHGSTSRWILQGFHDPDITILRRSVPTPETSDVPLCLQMLASLRARAWVGDVRGAFSQGMRNPRYEPLFALPPPGGIPGESDDIVI